MAHDQLMDDSPDTIWCRSLGPLAPNGAPWRCVLDDDHDGLHASAADPTWSTAEESGRAPLSHGPPARVPTSTVS